MLYHKYHDIPFAPFKGGIIISFICNRHEKLVILLKSNGYANSL